jgi:hypothetical protein
MFQSSSAPKSGRYSHRFSATVFKYLDAHFREMGISLPEQSTFTPDTSANCLILFIRETPGISSAQQVRATQ